MSSQAEHLRQAAIAGDVEQVKVLLKASAKIIPDLEGRTALHLAAANGHALVVKALIEGGAKINALDAAGYSPLHQAATEGHEEVVRVLLKNGCHVDTQDELHGNTALHEAAWKGYSRTLEILCKHRANVYIKNNGGFTPLHLACQNGHNQCCRVLLLAACKPDVRNSYGDTPLHTAARYGHAGVLRILISAFCNVNETNKNGDTALHIAAAMGRNKLTRILLEANCDQKLKNNQGEIARDIAERKEFTEVVKLLDHPPVTLIPVQDQTKSHSKSKKREKESGTSQESGVKEKKEKTKKSKKGHKVHFSDKESKGNISPYGCHMFPDMSYFPPINLKSLPKEPLKSGEQYYADLAGNIKKGPRGLGYMCYCAPFFNHVEWKLDANKKELLDHIDSKNEDLKAKISHLEQRTHDQLFSLNQKMKESLALERNECAERIDRRLFRERREMEQHQEKCFKSLQSEMKNLMHQKRFASMSNGNSNSNYYLHNGNIPLTRSKSEDLLSESNSNHNSMHLQSSTVTSFSRMTDNTHANHRTYLNPAQCGTKPKFNNNHATNVSRLKMKCLGYPELKRESRSEGDLTSCHTTTTDYNHTNEVNISSSQHQASKYVSQPEKQTKLTSNYTDYLKEQVPQDNIIRNSKSSNSHWKNGSLHTNSNHKSMNISNTHYPKSSDYDISQIKPTTIKNSYSTNHNHEQHKQTELSNTIHCQTNGLPANNVSLKHFSGNGEDRNCNNLNTLLDKDGSSFV